MATAQESALEGFREGSRWINQRPTGEQLAEWFKTNVTIHEGLKHESYVSGIVVIEQKEKIRQIIPKADGTGSVIAENERLTYTPYPTASARLVYWRDYLALEGHEEWRGMIEPDPSVGGSALPAGFFRYSVEEDKDGRKKTTSFVGCSMRARILGPDIRAGVAGREIMVAPAGSKVVSVVAPWGKADENALMKAQTGAVGRALAMAGMLVLPGTGIATAEDVRETLAAEEPPAAAAGAAEASLPGGSGESEVAAPGDPKAEALELISTLQAEYPAEHEKWVAWAKETQTDVQELTGTKLRGVVRRLRKHVDAGKAAADAAAATAAEAPDAPPED